MLEIEIRWGLKGGFDLYKGKRGAEERDSNGQILNSVFNASDWNI
jgi:hypothetical protein